MKLTTFDLRLVLPLFLAWTPALAQDKVWVVDDSGGPGVDFADLPPAIAAASPGDVLLLRTGTYSKPVLDKGLTLQADQGAAVKVPGLRVELVPGGQRVAIFGLTSSESASISDCGGKVWIEGCRFETLVWGSPGAVNVLDCADVVLVDVVGIGRSITPTPGLKTSNSSVHVFECTFEGSNGSWTDAFPGSALPMVPGPGALHESGELMALASTFSGGKGFTPFDPTIGQCVSLVQAAGAPGASLLAPSSMRDCQLHGGLGGFSFTCGLGHTGLPFSGMAPVQLLGEYVSLDVPSPIRENGTFDLTLSGSPGVLAIVGIAAKQDAIVIPAWGGSLVIQGPYLILPAVVLPPAGTLTQTIGLLDLGPSVQSLTFIGQVAAVDAFGAFTVNGTASVVLLDDQF